jgi:hypothetical protein
MSRYQLVVCWAIKFHFSFRVSSIDYIGLIQIKIKFTLQFLVYIASTKFHWNPFIHLVILVIIYLTDIQMDTASPVCTFYEENLIQSVFCSPTVLKFLGFKVCWIQCRLFLHISHISLLWQNQNFVVWSLLAVIFITIIWAHITTWMNLLLLTLARQTERQKLWVWHKVIDTNYRWKPSGLLCHVVFWLCANVSELEGWSEEY